MKVIDKVFLKIVFEVYMLFKELFVGVKSRKCLFWEESGCEFKGIFFDDLVWYM